MKSENGIMNTINVVFLLQIGKAMLVDVCGQYLNIGEKIVQC